VPGLARAALRMTGRLVHRAVFVGDFYVYRYPVPATDEHMPKPGIDGVEVHVVESERDVDDLVAAGYEDLRLVVERATARLSAGAVGVCAYVNKEFAYVGWVALSDAAKHTFDRLPYRVDYTSGEGCTGGAWTLPSLRGAGLYAYVFGHELRYLRDVGRTVCRNSIGTGNVASQRGQARYGAQLCAVGRLYRVLCWRRWVETPAEGPCPSLDSR
jgi:hypothetical protein